jgi:hypothetical protein
MLLSSYITCYNLGIIRIKNGKHYKAKKKKKKIETSYTAMHPLNLTHRRIKKKKNFLFRYHFNFLCFVL